MADNMRASGSSSYESGQGEIRRNYGRSSFSDDGRAYEAYGRDREASYQNRDRYYDSRNDNAPRRSWGSHADERSIWALGIGAGLGLLAGLLIPSTSYLPSISRQGDSDRRWLGRGSQRGTDLETDETTELIASNKVEGTAVYNRQGEKIGEIKNFMVGKRSGRVAYAVMSFGGLLGVGTSHYPLPWSVLDYDTEKGGYVVNLDKDRLSKAPSHASYETGFSDPGYGQRVSEYWVSAVL
jgi:hypothetical protein